MVDQATHAGLLWNASAVAIRPDAAGVEHDERRRGMFRFAQQNQRLLTNNARLHPTVFARLELDRVTKCDTTGPYRPKGLRNHVMCIHYYHADELIAEFGPGALDEAERLAIQPDDTKPSGYWERLVADLKRRGHPR